MLMKIDFVQHSKEKGVHVTRAKHTLEEFGWMLSNKKIKIEF